MAPPETETVRPETLPERAVLRSPALLTSVVSATDVAALSPIVKVKDRPLFAAVVKSVATAVAEAEAVVIVVWRAWLATDFACVTSFWIESMPELAAFTVLTARLMLSCSVARSEARLFRPAAVKNEFASSTAVLILLPVARRFCVSAIIFAVPCNESRLLRTADESVTEVIVASLPRKNVKALPELWVQYGPEHLMRRKSNLSEFFNG